MHTRSLRAALFTSLGLMPLACLEADSAAGGRLAPCGESAPASGNPDVVTGIYRCDNGVLHRPEPVTCASHLPRPLPPGAGADAGDVNETSLSQVEYLYPEHHSFSDESSQCRADSDCTQRPLGYCAPSYAAPVGSSISCKYGCLTDDDCAAGAFCECGEPVGHCVSATCRSDGDCAAGMKCADWFNGDTCANFTRRYSCQTSEDECLSGTDCGEDGICDASSGVRRCEHREPGTCGRPFLVSGEARVADLSSDADWVATEPGPEGLELGAGERALAAEHWARCALLEHASIAAFARFTLQLLQLGAPRALIEQSQLAMLDETAHARDCFELASRYLQAPVGPGALALQAALDDPSLVEIARLAFLEGCLGETVATLEAQEAHARAQDARVRQVLQRIAADEQSHAELAWRFLRWALERDARVRPILEGELVRIEAELAAAHLARVTPELTAHGVLGLHRLQQVRRAALAEVVLPCARGLLQRTEPAPARALSA